MAEKSWIKIKQTVKGARPSQNKWGVRHKDSDTLLGKIAWYNPWRQYVFEPEMCTVFSAGCQHDIGNFLDKLKEQCKLRKKVT